MSSRRAARENRRASSTLWRAKRPALKPWAALVLLALIGIATLLPLTLNAAATASPTPTPTPPATAQPTSSPTMSFETPTPLPSGEEFFGTDGRTNVADYDNPAFQTGLTGSPTDATASGYLDELLRDNADTVDIVILLTLLALVPTMLIMLTGFTRIVIVLGFTRNALGTQNMPPNQVIIGLSLFLTFFLVQPMLTTINDTALEPYLAEEITISEATELAMEPIRSFMLRQTWKTDVNLFLEIGNVDPDTIEIDDANSTSNIPNHILIPAFLTSELKHAFWMGFCIYIPFIVIDMIVASTLMSMGMMMLPPVMISLPFKILLFVSVDGWNLVIKTLLTGFR